MRHEAIALGVFILTSIALFSGLLRKAQAGKILGIIVAVGAAIYLIVALPPSLSTWARPHHHYPAPRQMLSTGRDAPMTTATPAPLASPDSQDNILVVALQGTFNATRSGLNTIYRAATGDETRVVADETVLQTIVGIVLTLLFAAFGSLGTVVRRAVGKPSAAA